MFTSHPNFSIAHKSNTVVQSTIDNKSIEKESTRLTITAYTPKQVGTAPLSLLKSSNLEPRKITTDSALVMIPGNAIIDKVSYVGAKNFTTSGVFDIGLGQLNNAIQHILIEDGTADIANGKQGGCRDFAVNNSNGANDKLFVTASSCVNITAEHPITAGTLIVTIDYHLKPMVSVR